MKATFNFLTMNYTSVISNLGAIVGSSTIRG